MLPVLSWSEIQELYASGLVEFGAHTRTHIRLPEVSPQIAWETIMGSKLDLEVKLGVTINAFCYPQGRYNATVIELVQKAGFRVAFGGTGFIHKNISPYELPRLQVEQAMSLDRLAELLEVERE
jgi:peptidoglycan/xylan/chitin deacetylase (PgdA/CDA1 family)